MIVDWTKMMISLRSTSLEEWPIGTPPIKLHLLQYLDRVADSNQLPIQPPSRTDVRSSERIEAAIRYFEERAKIAPKVHQANISMWEHARADLLRWVLGQDQDTWTDKDFGLEPEGAEEL